jgi:hypothetical protein
LNACLDVSEPGLDFSSADVVLVIVQICADPENRVCLLRPLTPQVQAFRTARNGLAAPLVIRNRLRIGKNLLAALV